MVRFAASACAAALLHAPLHRRRDDWLMLPASGAQHRFVNVPQLPLTGPLDANEDGAAGDTLPRPRMSASLRA